MTNAFSIKRATRQGVIPLIDLYSESGCGKTMSALLLARGLAGPDGKIVLVDTESRRGSLYADVIPGGFDVLDLDAPFTPQRYIDALTAAFAESPAAVVVDSMSHEWEGIGGVNDMAAESESRSGKPGLHNWRMPKMEHQKLVQFLLRSPVPVVCCIRAKYKTRQKKENGKTIIVRDEVTSPIQAEDFIFESTAHAEILPDHSINLTKCSHPSLRECFPAKGPITIQHGEMIAKWCNAAGVSATQSAPKPDKEIAELKSKLWNITAAVHGGDKTKLRQWLVDEALLDPDTPLEELTAGGLRSVTKKVSEKLKLQHA